MGLSDEAEYRCSFDIKGNADRAKVLYIMGMTRSGSTILDRILGQCEGYFSLGEAYSIWDLNVIKNQLCGCGATFNQCPVWKLIFDCAYHGIDQEMAKQMVRTWNAYLRTRHIPHMFFPYSGRERAQRLDYFKLNMQKLYQAICTVGNARVVIDSSKFPTYAQLLKKTPGIELFVVHIVRDPRAVAYSWLRRKKDPSARDSQGFMMRMTPAGAARLWGVWNTAGELILRDKKTAYMRVRYEDFIAEPILTTEKIVDLVGEPVKKLPFVSDKSINLDVNHTLSGNPNRFATGTQELRLDDIWKTKLDRRQRRVVTSITWPLLKRYGYNLRVL